MIAGPASIVLAADRAVLGDLAFVAWLDVAPADLAAACRCSHHRPVPDREQTEFFRRLVTERAAGYAEVADLRIDAGTLAPDAAAAEIVEATGALWASNPGTSSTGSGRETS